MNRSCWLQAAEARDRARAACKRLREELAEVREELAKTQKAADEAKMVRDRLDTESDALRCEMNRLRTLIGPLVREPGEDVESFAGRLLKQVKESGGRRMVAEFNGTTIVANEGDTLSDVLRSWAANLGTAHRERGA